MSILTDKLRSNLKVQTVSKQQVLGNAVLYSFIDESAAILFTTLPNKPITDRFILGRNQMHM